MHNITFNLAKLSDKKMIFEWLNSKHMQEFWDNSQNHRDDIIIFMNGRIQSSDYFDGIFTYWIGSIDNEPYCFIMTAIVNIDEKLPEIWKKHISKTGKTYSLDFGIGNYKFLNKGLAAKTLEKFIEFFKLNIDQTADCFFIDPDVNNPRAHHVYTKAGFVEIGNFIDEKGYFAGHTGTLMVKKI
jgi:RimJ/RimL family protein N-acetyltransferase